MGRLAVVAGFVLVAVSCTSTAEPSEESALKGPTEASALEFVSDAANQSAFSERFSAPMFTEPRVALDAHIEGVCAAVRFHEGGDSEMEPWTAFLRWEEDEWHLSGVTLIPDAHRSPSQFVADCYGQP